MRYIILALSLFLSLLCPTPTYAAFTEFYCDAATGSNLNGGSPISGGVYPITYVGGTYVQATRVFTVAAGDPTADGVTVGDFASIYTAGATTTGFVGRVSARDATTVTIHATASAGTNPVNGVYTMKVGGTWQCPNAADVFPFATITSTLTNASNDLPRVNLKNGTTYSTAATITASTTLVTYQGYTAAVGDGGKAVISPGANNVTGITITGTSLSFVDLELVSTAPATGSGMFTNTGAANTYLNRVVIHGFPGNGIQWATGTGMIDQSEIYGVGTANPAGSGGILLQANTLIIKRTIIHDIAGNNMSGIVTGSSSAYPILDRVIIDNVGKAGVTFGSTAGSISISNCDIFDATTDGITLANTGVLSVSIENTNILSSGGWGINGSGAGGRVGSIKNMGFGTGTQVNVSGDTTGLKGVDISGTVNYLADLTPWNAPATGDFRIVLSAAKGAGIGAFTSTAVGYTGTVGYPDIGSAQHLETAGGGTTSYAYSW